MGGTFDKNTPIEQFKTHFLGIFHHFTQRGILYNLSINALGKQRLVQCSFALNKKYAIIFY